MWSLGAFCDEFSVTTRLFLKLEIDPSREAILHYFEQLRRAFPRLGRLRRRDDGALLLDEEATEGEGRRYVRIDAAALKFGFYSPPDAEAYGTFAETVLKQAPYQLSLSDLDYDQLEVVMSFDLEYRGNHDELVAETFFTDHPLYTLMNGAGRHIIDCQPFWGITINENCDTQAYLEIKGRTTTFEVRSSEYENTPLTVYLTARRYWNAASASVELPTAHKELLAVAENIAARRVVPHVVKPLAAAIASRR
jgi:hypothetical protein